MKVVRFLPVWIIIVLVSVIVLPVIAADCPEIVKSALDATNNACSATGRNQACYGNISLSAEPLDASTTFTFTKPGDLTDISAVKKFILTPLDASADTWGVALLKVQANLPDTLPGQNVSFVLFGDVEIDNAVAAPAAILSVNVKQSGNLREQPSKTGKVVTGLKSGTELVADGISDDSAWLRVHSADASLQGWVSTTVVTVTGDVKTLAVVKADAPRYSPMQAFYFKSGLNDAPCSQAPDSGILIQTPQGAGKISLNVDGADVTLGSTAYFQAQANGEMTISVVEGKGTVTSGGKTVSVPAGSRVRVPLDANLIANGTPVGPEPYDAASLGVLPLRLMPQVVTIAPAFDPGAAIQPNPGKWLFTVNSLSLGGGCPPEIGQVLTAAMFPKTGLTVPVGPFDMKEILDSTGNKMPASAVITNPEPNQYFVDFNESGSTLHYELTVVATDTIAGTMNVNAAGCDMNFDVTMNHQG